MSYEQEKLQHIIEGALLAAGEALSVEKILTLFEENELPEKSEVEQALLAIQQNCEGRGFLLKEVASGWRFQVKEELATWVNRLWEEKPQKYSRALLETLALVAYRQPITRGDIEDVRGVAVSSHIIKTLSERDWIKVVGHRDVPGRPALYATTKQFLDYFNLKSLDELPTLGELRDIDELNARLDFDSLDSGDDEDEAVTRVSANDADSSSSENENTVSTENTETDEDERKLDESESFEQEAETQESAEQDSDEQEVEVDATNSTN